MFSKNDILVSFYNTNINSSPSFCKFIILKVSGYQIILRLILYCTNHCHLLNYSEVYLVLYKPLSSTQLF